MYTFTRCHPSLMQRHLVPGERLDRTPAVALGLTDWKWTVEEVLAGLHYLALLGLSSVTDPAAGPPLTASLLGELWKKAGGPAGTLQVTASNAPAAFSAPFF